MILLNIIAATFVVGAISVLAAAWLSKALHTGALSQMVSLSAGLLLGTAILHLIPEALESQPDFPVLARTMLIGLLVFFLLEKFSVLRHSHHHEGDGHNHGHGHDRAAAGPGGLLILVGDSIHELAVGVMIAAALMVDIRLGWITAIAIAAHEVPQKLGDFIVLVNAGLSRGRAIAYIVLAGAAAMVGGVVAYFALSQSQDWLPHIVVLAAASFIYIALVDIVPALHRRDSRRETAIQVLLLLLGVGISALVTSSLHAG